MPIIRKKRRQDGSLGHLESVTGLPTTDPNLVVAFDAIATQNELMMEQQAQIEVLKAEIESLKGGAS